MFKWFEDKDVEMEGLKVRVDAQEKELEELQTQLAQAKLVLCRLGWL